MKKVSLMILAVIMVVTLSACGGKGADSDAPHIGMWNAVSVSMLGITEDITEAFEEGVSLELKANGKYTLVLDGEETNGKWSYKDDELKLSGDGLDFSGYIEDGILKLINLLDMGLDLFFEKEGGYAGASRPKASQEAGYYVLGKASQDGETKTGAEFRDLGFDYYVLLNEDGTAVCQTDTLATGTWNGGVLNLYDDEGDTETVNYTVQGDELTIVWGDLTMVFVRSSEAPPAQTVGAGALSKVQQWWDGEWYGYWESHSVTDDYKHLDDGRWDCYAVIKMNPDDTGTLYLWEDGEDFATVEITVSADGGAGEMGAAVSEVGTYWNGDEIRHADWIIDPSLYGHDNYMVIDGRYEDEVDEGFNYVVYLRPWGELWEDIPEDERPPWYEDWYLASHTDPMLEAILDIDGYIHSELAGITVAEKPAPAAPVAPAGTAPVEVTHEMNGVIISATLPAQGWCPQDTPFGYNLYQVATCEDVYSGAPRISINVKRSLKDFDLHFDDFENLQVINNRKIGGIDMAGRTYQNVGMNWIEYTGVFDDAHAVSVNTSKIDISSGEASAVIDSIKFKADNPVATDVVGERISAGNVSALCPEGWKSFAVKDLWAEDENASDPDKLKFNKGAKGEEDQYLTPGLEIRYYGMNASFFEPGKDRLDNPKDWGPVELGGKVWKGFTGFSGGSKQAFIWAEDGDDEFLIAVLLDYGGKTISLEDADVRAIIASIKAP